MPSPLPSFLKRGSKTQSPPVAVATEASPIPATGSDQASRAEVSQGETTFPTIPAPMSSTSPTKSTVINALKFALQQLGKAPVPGIAAATGVILSIIDGIQSIPKAEKECKKLTKRIETLWYLVNNASQIEGAKGIIDRLVEELQGLGGDIEKASRTNKLEAFFNGRDDAVAFEQHNDELGDIISDLTFAVATATKKDTSQLREDIANAVKQLQATGGFETSAHAGSMVTRMSAIDIGNVVGDLDAENKVHGAGSRMDREFHGIKIGSVGGKAFSGNTVSTGTRA